MINRILGLVGWLGAALVFIGAAIRFGYPAQEQYVPYLVWTGLAGVLAYMAGQWRAIRGGVQRTPGALWHAGRRQRPGGARHSRRRQLHRRAAEQAVGSDGKPGVQPVGAEPQRPRRTRCSAAVLVFAQEPDFPRYRDRLKEYEYVSKQVTAEYIDPDKKPTVARQNQIQQYGTIVFNYKGRTERVTATPEQDITEQAITNAIIKVVSGQQRKVYFVQGHGERDTAANARERLQRRSPRRLGRENYMVEKLVLAQAGSVPDDASVVVVAGPKTDFFPAEIEALKTYLDKAGKLLLQIDPPDKGDGPPFSNLIALAHEWGMDVGNDIVVDASGMGRLIGTDAVVARRRHLWLASDHRELQLRDGVSAGALGDAGDGRRQRTYGAALRANQPAKLGGSRHQGHAGHRQSLARRHERR